MERLRKFLSLTPEEKQLLLSSFVLLGLVRLGLLLLPFGTLQRFMASISQVNAVKAKQYAPTIETIAKAVNISSRYMPGGAKCLARALTTQVLMNRFGYLSELRIGVAKGERGEFEAHAWVESQGEIVIGHLADLKRYSPMPSFGGPENRL
ncbi:lasso peptide biosynthesis B2 protein [Dapis sp. BLCC M126]|uniref:lasso peptide biosynthesis B2 protein n=1 Tax=Dapis sp. BLCC M126 TaxID=3400189 RepID=UPI003CEB0B51